MSTSCSTSRSGFCEERNSTMAGSFSPRSMFQSTTRMLAGGQKRQVRGAKLPVTISCMLGRDWQVAQLQEDVLACELKIAGVVDFRPWQAAGWRRANVNALVGELLDRRI